MKIPGSDWQWWQREAAAGLLSAALAVAFPAWNDLFWSLAGFFLIWAVISWMDKR